MEIKDKTHIYCPTGELWWAKTHAYLPTVDVRKDCLRVYFSSYDENKVGRIGYVDLDKEDPSKILYLTKEPILNLGLPGFFDCDGMSPSSIVSLNNKVNNMIDLQYLYYFGWQKTDKVPFLLFSSLMAISDSKIIKHTNAPILDRTPFEPITRSAPFVLYDEKRFKMWYVAAVDTWGVYTIRYLESFDGFSWGNRGIKCFDLEKGQMGIGRPSVIKEDGIYKMWNSYRDYKGVYKNMYSESEDGITWNRSYVDDNSFCFPYIVDVDDKKLIFYNYTKDLGASGFGYGVLS